MVDPIILFFLFGILAGALRSELRLPSQIYDLVIILLLLAIGLKGGIELSKQPFGVLLPQICSVVAIGFILPLLAFPVLRYLGRFKRADAASIAAHYGSVSVGTFAVAVAYMNARNIAFEEYMALFVVLLEVPAILVGILLARGVRRETQWCKVAHEVFMGKGVTLLVGGLLIGWIVGPEGIVSIEPLFFDLFKGFLALFLLEMGLITAAQLGSLKKYGLFLIGFGIVMPVLSALAGTLIGWSLGLSVGGTAMLAILTASASYIAVPAAMRISIPEANPTLSLTASLGITFPFNILLGIPLYYRFAEQAHVMLGG
ncbi:MAG: sodium-dependent bicarbonate transport family permease [Gammaproteobacteria bacterium]|nr:sodium-dependent bicarbonate transport family permease [Gammaproteobacteria bacterium]